MCNDHIVRQLVRKYARSPHRFCAKLAVRSGGVWDGATCRASGHGRVHTRSRVDFHHVTFQFALDIDLSFSAHVTNRLPGLAWPRERVESVLAVPKGLRGIQEGGQKSGSARLLGAARPALMHS